MKSVFICAVLFLIGASVSADAHRSLRLQWVDARGQRCDIVCEQINKRPVISGTYTNGEDLFICSANVNGEGSRAGYNLARISDDACTVGYGGGEHSISPYSCLCVRKRR
jgi:hypothetical protein